MIHANNLNVSINPYTGMSYQQIVQTDLLDQICEELDRTHIKKWISIITRVKLNISTIQIINLYGYRIRCLDSEGNIFLYEIEWN